MHLFGGHTRDVGGIDMTVRRAGAAGMRAMQLFTAIPKYYGDKSTIRPERIQRFRTALAETTIEPAHVMAHGAYVLNLATDDSEKYARASAGLLKELERSTSLGIGSLCFHPGAATGGDIDGAYARIAHAITAALEAIPGSTRVLVENTAGAGSTVGRTPEEIGAILDEVPKALRPRTGYGLDTCHLFAAGHDITRSAGTQGAVLDAFEKTTGEPPSFFHLNDSEGTLGSNRDRHALIGQGQIGVEPFQWLLHDRRSHGVPLILETPQSEDEIDANDPTPDLYDMQMLELLRSLE